MAGSVNKAFIVGFVGNNPEIRATRGGSKVATVNVATSKRWRDRSSGEMKESTQWHRVVTFDNDLAEMIEARVKKGTQLLVQGEISYRSWHDPKIDDKRYITEIVVDKFRGDLQVIEKDNIGEGDSRQGNAPPPDPDAYGSKPAQQRFQQRRQPQPMGTHTGDEEVPF